jgi:AcrR family transcriptional regulator
MTVSPEVAKRLDDVYSGNMGNNDNSVNIKSYHHGDLRAALIEEGLAQLAGADAETLSLRAIARKVGVSATAVYRHFPDKAALLKSLCIEGDRELAARFRAAQEKAGIGKSGFDAVGQAYVRFALDKPALFRLMMSKYGQMADGPADNREAEDGEAFRILLDGIARLTPHEASAERQRVTALQSWALVHGLATLMLDGLVPPEDGLISKVINTP